MHFFIRMLLCVVGMSTLSQVSAETFTDTRSQILGTEFSLTLVGLSQTDAQQVRDDILQEIARLDGLLSQYRSDSELMKFNAGKLKTISPELTQVLRHCEDWRAKTDSAFSCRIGGLLQTWSKAAEKSEVPERTALRKDARQLDGLDIDSSFTGTAVHWGIDGLAKGYIIDRALQVARQRAPQASGIKIDIGGDSVYWGKNGQQQPWHVAVAEPRHSPDNEHFYGVLALQSRAVAYSGHSRRYWEIGHRRFSHILNPQDGWPVSFAPSAIVVADDAVTADALATALTVMPISKGMALINRLENVESLIMTETGKTFASQGWYALLVPDEWHQPAWSGDMSFLVEYQIPSFAIAEYRKPYLALWITDANKQVVRQLLVHGNSPRWLREIPQWWRRYGRRDETMIDGLARPTPAPGQHVLEWDGRDDHGHNVKPGHYQLHIEAAREQGERELLVLPFELSGESFTRQAQGETEIGKVNVRFTRR